MTNGYLLDSLFDTNNERNCSSSVTKELISKISNNGKWDYSGFLNSPAMFIAVRAWWSSYTKGHSLGIDDQIEDWLFNPFNYYSRRRDLYFILVAALRNMFRDPRPEWKFYDTKEGIFNFQIQGYGQSWAALKDIDILAKAAGYKGLIILVDEFEDVIYNLQKINYQQEAFWNLFQFFSKEHFPGLAFFAVTPNFVEKCKILLENKDILDYDYSRFDKLEKFEMSPLSTNELLEVCIKIIPIHEMAYDWKINDNLRRRLVEICKKSSEIAIKDRVRQTIKKVVNELDEAMES